MSGFSTKTVDQNPKTAYNQYMDSKEHFAIWSIISAKLERYFMSHTLLSAFNPKTSRYALTLRDLDKNKGWKEVNGFYFDPSDAEPKPFVVQGVFETEKEGQEAKAALKMYYGYHTKSIREDVCTKRKY